MSQFGRLKQFAPGWYLATIAAGAAAYWQGAIGKWEHTATADAAPYSSAGPSAGTVSSPPGGAAPLPTDKLSCKTSAKAPRTPVVLVCCGSFNPPTVMHMRMVDLASDDLMRRGYDVWGAYLSPVADAYGKTGLASAAHRVSMCRLAADDELRTTRSVLAPTDDAGVSRPRSNRIFDLTMVYDWEARQQGYTRTLAVLQRVESELRRWVSSTAEAGEAEPSGTSRVDTCINAMQAHGHGPSAAATSSRESQGCQLPPTATKVPTAVGLMPSQPPPRPPPEVRAILLCGADVLASMAVPGVWKDPDVILRDHGVVCVAREGTDIDSLINKPGSVLCDNRDGIVVVYDRVGNSISSTKVRQELAAGRPVRYLVPPAVLSYIYEKSLYGTERGHGGKE